MIANFIVGLVTALCAWLIVDAIMAVLYNGQFGTWSQIITAGGQTTCLNLATQLNQAPPGVSGSGIVVAPASGGVVVVTPSAACPTCVSLASLGVPCKSASSCTVASALANKLSFFSGMQNGWRVTEAYPPTVTHTAVCHNDGTCVDASFTVYAYSAANVVTFGQAALSAGLRPVLEVQDCTLRDAVRLLTTNFKAYCASDDGYAHITGNHFSLYNN